MDKKTKAKRATIMNVSRGLISAAVVMMFKTPMDPLLSAGHISILGMVVVGVLLHFYADDMGIESLPEGSGDIIKDAIEEGSEALADRLDDTTTVTTSTDTEK